MQISAIAMFSLLLSGCATSGMGHRGGAASSALQYVKGSAKVYRGPEGIEVALVSLRDGQVLLRVTGAGSPVDGKVLPCRFDESNPRRAVYITEIDGRERWILHVERAWGGRAYRLYVPGASVGDGIVLQHDEERSRALTPKVLLESYRQQVADGTLAALQRFDRAAAQREQQQAIDKGAAAMNQRCGAAIKVTVDWGAMDDATVKATGVASRCSALLSAVAQICAWRSAREIVGGELREVRCAIGKARRLVLEGGRLLWSEAADEHNAEQFARKQLMTQLDWKGGIKLARLLHREDSAVCHDGKGTYVGWQPAGAPEEYQGQQPKETFFGDGNKLRRVARADSTGEGWFYDPRFFAPQHNANFRGVDYRFYSRLELDREQGRCSLSCGTRKVPLQLLQPAAAQRVLEGATIEPAPLRQREPYGLARDRQGTYYFVDRGVGERARDFRLLVGRLGKLKRIEMLNIVSDSEGDIFSTRAGDLRLVLEKEHSFWIRRGARKKLINVPIGENLNLIYNELGVYLGEPLGTPCDRL